MNSILYFEIHADDPQKSAHFYEQIFNWKFEKDHSLPIEYYRITTPGMHGGLLRRPAVLPSSQCGSNAFVCSVEVRDFDATATLIMSSGGKISLPRFAIPGKCWQGYFTDPDGNVFGIFQADTSAH